MHLPTHQSIYNYIYIYIYYAESAIVEYFADSGVVYVPSQQVVAARRVLQCSVVISKGTWMLARSPSQRRSPSPSRSSL